MFQYLTCLSVPTSPVSRIAGEVVNQCSPTNIEATPQKNNFTQEPLRHSEPQKKHRSLRHQPFTADVACTLIFDAVTTPVHKKLVSKKAPVSPASAVFTQDVSEAISSHVAAFLGDEPDTSLTSSTDSGFSSHGSSNSTSVSTAQPRDQLVFSKSRRRSAVQVRSMAHSNYTHHQTLAIL